MKLRDILIVSDIDGTLLPENLPIPIRNREALQRFSAKGGRFTLATGRSIGSAGRFLGELPVNVPAVCLNGCLLYHYASETVLARCELQKEETAPLVRTLYSRFPQLGQYENTGDFFVYAGRRDGLFPTVAENSPWRRTKIHSGGIGLCQRSATP